MRRTIAIVLLLVLAWTFAACDLGTETSNTSADGNSSAEDAIYELKMDLPDPADSVAAVFLYAWTEQVKEASGGRVNITIYPDSQLGAAQDIVVNLKNKVSDIAWAEPDMFPERFPVTEGTNLSALAIPNCIVGTDLLNALYNNTEFMQKEYEGIRPLAIYMAPDDSGGGIGRLKTAFLLMNPDSYDKLPEDLKEIFDALCTKELAYGLAKASEEAILAADPDSGDSGSVAEPPRSDEPPVIDPAAEQAARKWVMKMNESGYDGQAVLDTYNRILSELSKK